MRFEACGVGSSGFFGVGALYINIEIITMGKKTLRSEYFADTTDPIQR